MDPVGTTFATSVESFRTTATAIPGICHCVSTCAM